MLMNKLFMYQIKVLILLILQKCMQCYFFLIFMVKQNRLLVIGQFVIKINVIILLLLLKLQVMVCFGYVMWVILFVRQQLKLLMFYLNVYKLMLLIYISYIGLIVFCYILVNSGQVKCVFWRLILSKILLVCQIFLKV